ncbi:hypothetical protein ACIGXF_04335 [Streptomyces sp. NPDC053086]|uniref:hypothetical protein n=1 Tax=unclassified Streptomyces TaxID=2593676 RepID=UPI0037CF6B99
MPAEHEDARDAANAGGNGAYGRQENHEGQGNREDKGSREEYGDHGNREDYRKHGNREEYDGMDALMAAITGDPLPEEAHRDPAFLAEHRAAETDVAVLRDRLAWLAEALTGEEGEERSGAAVARGRAAGDAAAGGVVVGGAVAGETAVAAGDAEAGTEVGGTQVGEPGTGDAAAGDAEAGGTEVGEPGAGDAAAGEPAAGEPAVGDAAVGGTAVVSGAVRAGASARPRRPRSRVRRVRPARPARPPRPGRASGPRRAVRIALGSLAGVAVFSLALGFGRLVTQGGLTDDDGGASKSADAASGTSATGERPADPERELACSRLVVEGTVTRVERQEDSARSRVTLTVSRSYRPAHGPAEVGFLLDAGAWPAPRTGQHALVTVARGERYASLWAVGDARVAAERAWITEALPGSRALSCPSDDAS